MKENNLFDARIAKFDFVKSITNPYPERFELTHSLCEASKLQNGTKDVRVAGRLMAMRKMGKLSFVTIADVAGKIQIAIKKDILGEEQYDFFKKAFDIGDFMGVAGDVFTTDAGEKTIRATMIYFIGKSFRPLPEKFHGVSDMDIRQRQRYLDLCMNDETKERFLRIG